MTMFNRRAEQNRKRVRLRLVGAGKILPLIAGSLALASCSLVQQPPNEAKARALEAGRGEVERDAQVRVHARKLERSGMSALEARALAQAQVRGGWP